MCRLPDFVRNEKPEEDKRARWNEHFRVLFIWAGCAFCMGISNFTVFPALCAKHGGLRFFGIPYTFMLLFIVIPLMILEFSLGQKFQNGNIWPRISTNLAGIGYAQAYVAFVFMIAYSVQIGWILMYVISSFSLPWASKDWPYD